MTSQEMIDLARRYHHAGDLPRAEAVYRQVLFQPPHSSDVRSVSEALNGLGIVLLEQGKLEEAIRDFGQAVSIWPEHRDAWNNLGNALRQAGRPHEAIGAFERVLSKDPNDVEALNNLGALYEGLSQHGQAVEVYRRAIAAKPDSPETSHNLGISLELDGKLEEAIEAYRSAIALKPDLSAAYNNLGNALRETGQLDEALTSYQRARSLLPRSAPVRSNIANLLKDMGEVDAAIEWYREALALEPHPHIGSNLLCTMLFQEGLVPSQLWQEHQRWNQMFARPLSASIKRHENEPDPGRRIRIGYVSPEFRAHPVGRFIFPLLMRHDHSQFEVHCYSDVRTPDGMTELFKSRADVWRETRGMPDERVADSIRQDRIDILVDLTIHADGCRLLVFARKPAPVQVTYLAYPGTTGLEAVDYRLTDSYLDPPGRDESFYSEKSVRLRSYWCYQPLRDVPDVVPPPALSSGIITFGCLNNFGKMSRGALAAWCELLRRVPNSRLILHAREGSHRQRTFERFAGQGIDPKRVEFVSGLPMPEYFARYNQIDIALDPFPYPGGTTTCDTLWMGVPVVSLAGEAPHSRAGVSILSNIGLPELVAHDVEEYVRIAKDLAADPPRLSRLRREMRSRMLNSPLMDAPAFAGAVEDAFRQVWKAWCDAPA